MAAQPRLAFGGVRAPTTFSTSARSDPRRRSSHSAEGEPRLRCHRAADLFVGLAFQRAELEGWQNGYCTGLENRRPQGLGGSNPSPSAGTYGIEGAVKVGVDGGGVWIRLIVESRPQSSPSVASVARSSSVR